MSLRDGATGYLNQLGFRTPVNLLHTVVRAFTSVQSKGFFKAIVQKVMNQGIEGLDGNSISVRYLLAGMLLAMLVVKV